MNFRLNIEYIRLLLRWWPTVNSKKKLYLSPMSPATEGGLLEKAVRKAIKNVPFYKDYDKYLEGGFDLSKFPIIDKYDIKGHTRELVPRHIPSFALSLKRTSGSTGIPLEVYYSPKIFIEKDLIVQHLFDSFGKKQRIAMLRGNHTDSDSIVTPKGNRRWVFSSYKLSEDTVERYIAEMKRLKINVLHVYPSAISIFARLIKKKYGTCPLDIKGIFTSSESFDVNEKKFVMSVFPQAKLIDGFGQNELCCYASAENDGYFHFYNNFGYVELMPTGETTPSGNRVCQVVATSIMNTTMPLIRYATRDNVEVDDRGNVICILGRSSDMVVTADRRLIPCVFLESRDSLKNVINRQYWQPAEGKFVMRVVVNENFGEKDKQSLINDISATFGKGMDIDIMVVDHIEKGANGKQKRLQQDLDIDRYRG